MSDEIESLKQEITILQNERDEWKAIAERYASVLKEIEYLIKKQHDKFKK